MSDVSPLEQRVGCAAVVPVWLIGFSGLADIRGPTCWRGVSEFVGWAAMCVAGAVALARLLRDGSVACRRYQEHGTHVLSKIVLAIAVLTLATACGRPGSPTARAELDRIRQLAPGITEECARVIQTAGIQTISNEVDQCFEMLPRQRWRGLWRNDFEGSLFCPAPATTCTYEAPQTNIWLNPKSLQGVTGALYAVEFVGRRTKVKGNHGHLGTSAHEIIVDQPISIRMIAPPPPPLTEAELVAFWRRCEAARTCIPSSEMRKLMNRTK